MISCLCGTRDPRELTFFQCWNRARAFPPGVICQISCHEVKLFQLPGQSDSAGFMARSGHMVKAYDGICYRIDLAGFVLKIASCNQNSFHSKDFLKTEHFMIFMSSCNHRFPEETREVAVTSSLTGTSSALACRRRVPHRRAPRARKVVGTLEPLFFLASV